MKPNDKDTIRYTAIFFFILLSIKNGKEAFLSKVYYNAKSDESTCVDPTSEYSAASILILFMQENYKVQRGNELKLHDVHNVS
jgi:hypothetical protein